MKQEVDKMKINLYISTRTLTSEGRVFAYTLRKKIDVKIVTNKIKKIVKKYLPSNDQGLFFYVRIFNDKNEDERAGFTTLHSVKDVDKAMKEIKDSYLYFLKGR